MMFQSTQTFLYFLLLARIILINSFPLTIRVNFPTVTTASWRSLNAAPISESRGAFHSKDSKDKVLSVIILLMVVHFELMLSSL